MVANGDRTIHSADADVDVVRPRVVPQSDPLKLAAEPLVVLRVDYLLVEVACPGVRSPRGEPQAHLVGKSKETLTMLRLHRDRVGEVLATAGADLDLGVDELARRRDGQKLVF